jgi:hypothetical protein
VPRIECCEHGVQQVPVAWAETNSRFTGLFEALAINWLKEGSIQAVARLMHLTWEVDGIMLRAVVRGLRRRELTADAAGGAWLQVERLSCHHLLEQSLVLGHRTREVPLACPRIDHAVEIRKWLSMEAPLDDVLDPLRRVGRAEVECATASLLDCLGAVLDDEPSHLSELVVEDGRSLPELPEEVRRVGTGFAHEHESPPMDLLRRDPLRRRIVLGVRRAERFAERVRGS